ncbi:hypothetical protein [Mycolicibacterium sp. 624]|uniref:hypothetical protein n=1 Tax=Mycolicibacterium sp. 624 TaxID=3156314 RepID=UPI003392300D
MTRWTAFAVLALVFSLAGIGAEWALVGGGASTPHGPHALAAAPGGEFTAITEHPHIQDGSASTSPDSLARPVLPRVSGVLAALGLIVALTTVFTVWQHRATTPVRGPPCSPAIVLAGRQLLTRLCVARR